MPENIATSSFAKKDILSTLLLVALGIATINVQPSAAAATKKDALAALKTHHVLKLGSITETATKEAAWAIPNKKEISQIVKTNRALKVDIVDATVPITDIFLKAMQTTSEGSTSGALILPPQFAASENDDSSECSAEVTACAADTACLACATTFDDSTCDGDAFITCADVIDYGCCAYGDSCKDNAPLVAYVDCAFREFGCSVANDLCDTQDDNGVLNVPCSAERLGCMDSSVCAQCVDDFFPTDDDDATATTDDDGDMSCVDLNDGVCQLLGTSATCTSNVEYEDFVECIFEEAELVEDCTIELCDASSMGDDNSDDGTCLTEKAACMNDPDCAACWNTTTPLEDCDYLMGGFCLDWADQRCCYYGESCSTNALLLAYADCENSNCGFTDFCDYDDDYFSGASSTFAKMSHGSGHAICGGTLVVYSFVLATGIAGMFV